jgi:phosphohistidine phosphatase SixA
MKLILVRYGEHEDGHLSDKGKETVLLVAKKLESLVRDKKVCIISANILRAIESAKIISEMIGVSPIEAFDEFYAAEEKNIYVDIGRATKILDSLSKKFDVTIAVVSREYIKELGKKDLRRGDILALDYK